MDNDISGNDFSGFDEFSANYVGGNIYDTGYQPLNMIKAGRNYEEPETDSNYTYPPFNPNSLLSGTEYNTAKEDMYKSNRSAVENYFQSKKEKFTGTIDVSEKNMLIIILILLVIFILLSYSNGVETRRLILLLSMNRIHETKKDVPPN